MKRKFCFYICSLIIIAANLWWYFYWIPYVTNLSGIVHYPMVSFRQGITNVFSNILPTLNRFYFTALKSFIAFAVFLYGTILAIRKKESLITNLLILGFISFLPFIFKSGFNFYHHSYYVIPFVPVMAVLAGYALSQIKKKYILSILLTGIFIESIANQQHDFFIRKTELYKLKLEQVADSISSPNDLIAIQGINGNPQELYFSHRKGWLYNPEKLNKDEYVNQLAKEGCKYIFVNKRNYIEPGGKKQVDYEDEFYKIFRISPK